MFVRKEPAHVIRQVTPKDTPPEFYLTFDDGPSEAGTEAVLDLLKKHQAQATFFVIGEKAKNQTSLIQRMLAENHRVASHSCDHRYYHYFQNREKIKLWIQNSLTELENLTQQPQKIFRPPAGILTPPLVQAAEELGISLILWKHRLYDSIFSIEKNAVDQVITSLNPGDIILLHDHQKQKNLNQFLSSLDYLILQVCQKHWKPSSLSF